MVLYGIMIITDVIIEPCFDTEWPIIDVTLSLGIFIILKPTNMIYELAFVNFEPRHNMLPLKANTQHCHAGDFNVN